MSDSLLFVTSEFNPAPAVLAEGKHHPDALASASGVYITASGTAMLEAAEYHLSASEDWVWLALENGVLQLTGPDTDFTLKAGDCCMIPSWTDGVELHVTQEARVLWMMVGGTLSSAFLQRSVSRRMRALRRSQAAYSRFTAPHNRSRRMQRSASGAGRSEALTAPLLLSVGRSDSSHATASE